MSGKVLYCLWINARIEKIGDVSVPQLMGRHIEVQRIFDFGLILLGHTQRWSRLTPSDRCCIPSGCCILWKIFSLVSLGDFVAPWLPDSNPDGTD